MPALFWMLSGQCSGKQGAELLRGLEGRGCGPGFGERAGSLGRGRGSPLCYFLGFPAVWKVGLGGKSSVF